MKQRQQWHSSGGEQAWLALLVETFESVSRDPINPADPASITALKLQLARPAASLVGGSLNGASALH